jgi:hypothetical protein
METPRFTIAAGAASQDPSPAVMPAFGLFPGELKDAHLQC